MQIYYIYEKETGRYAGSGTPKIDNETHSYTTNPVPDHDSEKGEVAFYKNGEWVVK